MSQIEIKPAIFLFANVRQRDFYETHFLCLMVGWRISKGLTQKIKKIDKTFYFGKGKIQELITLLIGEDPDIPIITNAPLNQTQRRNIEEATNHRIITRTEIIFQIFREGAKTSE
ncbi:MAG: hypothetical protein IJQ67_01875, partial [Bacilli bacterium]|nr:hypothetical protein [Bacilli bacterium]